MNDVKPEIRGYQEVRRAARDFATYSSDFQGEQAFRSYRVIPLELDPPRHAAYRRAMQPLFMSNNIAPKTEQFRSLARKLLGEVRANGGGEIGMDLALPYVVGCLGILYNRPQDVDEWVSWGASVWTAEAQMKRVAAGDAHLGLVHGDAALRDLSGATLDAYLDRVLSAATPAPGSDPESTDVWDWVSGLQVDGQYLTHDEKFGIATILLAGGRDTVIKLVTGLTWHLVNSPGDREYLQATPEGRPRAVAELVRYLSPLPKAERLSGDPTSTELAEDDPRRYVFLNYHSANHDKSVWPDSETIDIRRPKQPHLGFGFGRHSCMGMSITEHETAAFLDVLLEAWPGWVFDGEPSISWTPPGEFDGAPVVAAFRRVNVVIP